MSIRKYILIIFAAVLLLYILSNILTPSGLLSIYNTSLSKHNNSEFHIVQSQNNPWNNSKNKLILAAVGDINFARGVAKHIDTTSYDRPLCAVSSILNSADITTGNLESPISDLGSPMDKKYVFRANPKVLEVLEDTGFDVLSIANNHAFDYGLSAFIDCIDRFNNSNIRIIGGGQNLEEALRSKFLEANGLSLGFLAFNDTKTNFIGKDRPACAPAYEPLVFNEIATARGLCDILIVHIHWGEEYSLLPNDRQIALGHAMIDSGATIILGHHPHSWQAVEFYRNGLIAYSLGNFLFDQKDLMNNLSAIMFLEFEGVVLKEVRLKPIELITTPKEARPAIPPLSDIFIGYLNEGNIFTSTEVIKISEGTILLVPILKEQ